MKRIGLLNGFSRDAIELTRALDTLSESQEYQMETLEEFGLQESVSTAIWGLINLCDVLIAFVNESNQNLYYQIGLAHGAGKPVIIVTDQEYSLPADLRSQRILNVAKHDIYGENFLFQLREMIGNATRRKVGHIGPRGEYKYYSMSQDHRPANNFRDLFTTEGLRRFKWFERWFSEIASGVDGWEVIEPESKNRIDRGFDLVIWNSIEDPELAILGNPIAVEMKAIGSMNSSGLHDLLHLSKKSGIKGLILATTGLNNNRTKKLLSRLRDEEGINAIAFDRDDLIDVKKSSDLLLLVKSKVRGLLYREEF